MRNVFISYRRDDSSGFAGRIAERLRAKIGDERVFFDEHSIEDGADWQKTINDQMKATTLLIAVIGPRWFDAERRARLADPNDKVRQEIAAALATKTAILPVLVEGARMPDASALPEDLRGLTSFQALPLPEPYFDQGIERILQRLERSRRRLWIGAGAAAFTIAAVGAIWFVVSQTGIGKSIYVVQVFEEQNGAAVPNVKVRLKSLVTEELAVQTTDSEGLTRFQLRNGSILALGLEYPWEGRCIGARLPAFAAPKLPAVTPVYLDSIPPRLKGTCGDTGASNVRSVSVRYGVPSPAARSGVVTGQSTFLREHLPWGTPAAPTIISRHGYVVGFDSGIKLARWVGYKVASQGSRRRLMIPYLPDPQIPPESQLASSAYVNNPYDRGNLIRRLDVAAEDEREAFYLSVVAPQADRMNRGVWVKIEEAATRAAASGDVWVLAGTAFVPAPGSSEVVTPRLSGNVPVPTHWFRIAVRRNREGSLEALSFLVPNDFTVVDRPEQYLTSITNIERVTGLRLLADLPEPDRARLTARPATSMWHFE